MNGRPPAPDFDAQNYVRPNQNWTCGRACEGKPCREGPDGKGHCQATAECKPLLETKPGESKGRWRCTRAGGPCGQGPLPDGSCCNPVPRCSPRPTLRLLRGRITIAVVALSCAVLLVVPGNAPWRNKFINPGEISLSHSGAVFAALASTNHLNPDCGACHVAGSAGPNGMLNAALKARPGIFDLKAIAQAKPAEPTAIDAACMRCHAGKDFHQPGAAMISCSFCHAEHQGRTMAATTDANCDFCHGDPVKMTVSPAMPVIHHFADDHPQFRFITEKLRDPDTLKFNHELHLTGATIPKLPGGRKLDCAYCHQPDEEGAFMKPVEFERNCRVCHSLQFDPETPQLMLPHGSAEFVLAYLHSLPKQYADLGAKENPADANGFASRKLAGLRSQFGSGEDLERRVFFSTAVYGPEAEIGNVGGNTRAIFPGCVYCHEVKAPDAGLPVVTKPVIPERWLAQARFNHAEHANISCEQCHDAAHSRDTADIILPPKETCAACHSPRGGVASSCAECHRYHNFKPENRDRKTASDPISWAQTP